jgi:transcriptional regulator with XRE-family HTH domain
MNLTAQEFGDRLGVTRGAVQQWEKAKGTAPSRKHQGAVAALLGLTVPELMNPDPNPGEMTSEPAPLLVEGRAPSENARVLAQLYDMLPDDLIKRTEAYNAATAEIIAVLHGRPRPPSPAPNVEPEVQKAPKKQRA